MIDLRNTPVKGGSSEAKIMEQLDKEEVPFQFGEVRVGSERQDGIILADRFAISFKRFSPGIEGTLRANKLKPQVWSKAELSFETLSLKRRLLIHGQVKSNTNNGSK